MKKSSYSYSQKKSDDKLDSLINKLNRLENGPTVKLDLDELNNKDKKF